MRVICALVLAAAAPATPEEKKAAVAAREMQEAVDAGDIAPDQYMTENKARDIVDTKLPESQKDLDSRLNILKGTAVFQLGKIDRQIPIALLSENGDVTVSEVIPGAKGKTATLKDCAKQLQDFSDAKQEDLKKLQDDISKLKGTIVDFRLIDDMANDPGHPWIHSATYNKTSVARKADAVAKMLQTWISAMNKNMIQATTEYLPPFNISLSKLNATQRPPAPALAWIEGYTQSTRIVLVMAQLLKKFSAKGMAEGLRIGKAPIAAPLNVKDYLDVLKLAARKVSHRIKDQLVRSASSQPNAGSLMEAGSSLVDAHFSDLDKKIEDLRAVVVRETKAMKAGFLPKASSLLMAYGTAVSAIQNANNATRSALKLPGIFLSERASDSKVFSAILHGDMAEYFYGKKLKPTQTIADWGIKQHKDGDKVMFSSLTEGAPAKYRKLRDDFEKRTPGYAAYDEKATYNLLHPQVAVVVNPLANVDAKLEAQLAKLKAHAQAE